MPEGQTQLLLDSVRDMPDGHTQVVTLVVLDVLTKKFPVHLVHTLSEEHCRQLAI